MSRFGYGDDGRVLVVVCCQHAPEVMASDSTTSWLAAGLTRREAEVARLEQQRQQLEHRIASVDSSGMLIREARRLGLVKPGERLYIVRGISTWRKNH